MKPIQSTCAPSAPQAASQAQGHLHWLAAVLFMAAVWLALAPQTVRAADAPAQAGAAGNKAGAAPSAPALPANSYTVKKGDTLDKLIFANYQASPLKPEILRNAILQANPQLGKGKSVPLRPGSQLMLPEHGQIIMAILGPYLPPAPEPPAEPQAAAPTDPLSRRDWIRFP